MFNLISGYCDKLFPKIARSIGRIEESSRVLIADFRTLWMLYD